MMSFERLLLVAFFGNYVINTVVAACVAMIPATQGGGVWTLQYIVFLLAAAIAAALTNWWYLKNDTRTNVLQRALIFSVGAFLIALISAFISGTANVLLQTGSFAQVIKVIPNFKDFVFSKQTLYLFGYWIVPAILLGFYLQRKNAATPQEYQQM